DPQMCTWLGAQMPADQRRAMLAEARAQLRAQGVAEAELPVADDEPGRWIRGQLQLEGHQLRLEVNSRERFAALLELLRQLGAQPQVVDESRVDPQQDFAWGDGPSLLVGGRAAPEEGWEGHWLDEPVPALRGRTPRQAAAGSPEERAGLEALLRDFEYRGGLLALRGGSGPDVAYLREQLQAADS
ncbi:MAG TPA: hypothetical protein VNE21_05750, partial [Mycobacteriales bacterium]|nr:hypothetical protein [Mycobacteriales bacterium]